MIAALFVETGGPYFGLSNVDPWDVKRDARNYDGPFPIVAHPPCERWGRYWGGGPSVKVKKEKGDDGGCFLAAFDCWLQFGGVIEHPEASHAWTHFEILRPNPHGGWTWDALNEAWVCQVEQGHYGHPARKKTWLAARTITRPAELIWGPSQGKRRLDEGFRSKEHRDAARAAGQRPIKRLSSLENRLTPIAFRDVLIEIAKLGVHQEVRRAIREDRKSRKK